MKFIRFHRGLVVLAALLSMAAAVRADLASIIAEVQSQQPPEHRPSLILIQCHGLGYGDLSCYGQTNFQTPNLDRLAAEGVRCTQYTAGNNGSSPAPAVLLFGKKSAGAKETTFARRLQLAGYRTGLIGEWGLAGNPWEMGFDEFAGFMNYDEAKNYYADYLWRYAPNSIFDATNNRLDTFIGKEMLYPNTGGKKGQYLPDLFVSAAVNFVQNNQPEELNHFRPFFLLLNLPAPRTATPGADDFPVPSDAPFTGEPWPPAAKNRAALITRLDNGIGRLLEQLQKSGLTNNLALFFTSAAPPEKFANAKLDFLRPNGELRGQANAAALPMIVRWPEALPGGQVSDWPWSAADFAPTALEIGYARPATNFTGASILPQLRGKK